MFNERTLAYGIIGNRFLIAMPGLLTGVGVLGTFVGLQLGIGSLELGGSAVEELDRSITPLIKGSATAFSTSVWGVVCSLVFGIAEKGLESISRLPIRRLQQRLNRLVPRYHPEESMIGLHRSSLEQEQISKGLAVAIGEQMQKAMERIGSSISEAVRDALGGQAEDLGKMSADLMSQALTDELEKLRESVTEMGGRFQSEFSGANSALQQTISGFTEVVRGIDSSVQNTRTAVEKTIERLEGHDEVVLAIREAAIQLDGAAEKLLAMRDTFDTSAKNNADAAGAQHDAAEINKAVVTEFKTVGERLPEVRDAISEGSRVIAAIGQPLLELKDVLATTPDLFREQATRQSESDEKRASLLLGQTESLANAVKGAAEKFAEVEALGESLKLSAEGLERAGRSLSGFGDDFVRASDLQASAASASEKAATAGERAAETLRPIPDAVEKLAEDLKNAGTSVSEGAVSAKETYSMLIDLQRQWFEGVQVGLERMRDRVQEIIDAYGGAVEGNTQIHMDQWTSAVNDSLSKFSAQVQTLEGAISEIATPPRDR